MFKKTILSLSVCGLLTGAQSALAYEQGDIIVRGGAAIVEPNESSSTISVDQPALGDTGIGGVKVGADTQLGVSATYMYSNNFGIEVLAATPFEHDIDLPVLPTVNPALGEKIASAKHLPPTVTLNYHLNKPGAKFQPYVGAGLNYTIFFSEDVTSNLDNAGVIDVLASSTGNLAAGTITSASSTKINLDDSFGIALKVGFDYALTDTIGLSASYYRMDIDTEAEITTNTNAGKVKATVDVDIDPSVYLVGLSYKF